jgi:hypothetical protein
LSPPISTVSNEKNNACFLAGIGVH